MRPRSIWSANPLGYTGAWTAADGRDWFTECDTDRTGRNGCRSWARADVIESTPKASGGYEHRWVTKWVFNNIVQFS